MNDLCSLKVRNKRLGDKLELLLAESLKGNLVSLFVNNERLRDIRVQALQQDWQVGLWAENGDNEKEAEVQFKHVKVTDAPYPGQVFVSRTDTCY